MCPLPPCAPSFQPDGRLLCLARAQSRWVMEHADQSTVNRIGPKEAVLPKSQTSGLFATVAFGFDGLRFVWFSAFLRGFCCCCCFFFFFRRGIVSAVKTPLSKVSFGLLAKGRAVFKKALDTSDKKGHVKTFYSFVQR